MSDDLVKMIVDMRYDICSHLHRIEESNINRDTILTTLTDQVMTLIKEKGDSLRVRRELSDADLAHEAKLAANIIKTDALETAIHETNALAQNTVKTLQEQSDFMGLGKRGISWVGSKEGRASLSQAAVVIGIVYGILKSSGIIK